jgi:hypothetical protein
VTVDSREEEAVDPLGLQFLPKAVRVEGAEEAFVEDRLDSKFAQFLRSSETLRPFNRLGSPAAMRHRVGAIGGDACADVENRPILPARLR